MWDVYEVEALNFNAATALHSAKGLAVDDTAVREEVGGVVKPFLGR